MPDTQNEQNQTKQSKTNKQEEALDSEKSTCQKP